MSVTIKDNRIVWSDANTANWDGSTADALFTSAPAPKELTGCLGFQVSQAEEEVYFVSTSVDLSSGIIVGLWVLVQGTGDNTTAGGIGILLGDGTDRVGYYVAGADVAGFRHDTGGVGWQHVILDTSLLPTGFTTFAGTEASLTLTAITQIGASFAVSSKSLGGAENCFTDVVYFGNDGLTITAGVSGTSEGTFSDIASADASDIQTDSSYGVCRELGSGLFGLQGALTFGDTGTTATYFKDNNVVVNFEDRNLGTDKYYLKFVGNTTNSTTFQLGNKSGTIGGSDGCSLICPAGVGSLLDATHAELDFFNLYATSVSGFENGINLSHDVTNAPNHEIYACIFSGNGIIDIGLTSFKNNIIGASTNNTGSTLIVDTTNVTDLSFVSDGTGHAIYITSASTYTFANFEYSGFAGGVSGDTGNEVVYNNSGGLVTINVTDGATPSYRNGVGATTVINNNVSITISGLKDKTEIRVYDNATLNPQIEVAGIEEAIDGTIDDRSFTFSLAASSVVDIVYHNKTYESIPPRSVGYIIPSTTTTISIVQLFDPNYNGSGT